VFAALATAGGATLLFALGGVVLVLLDRSAPGVVVESIAVIPAAGTLIFWRLYRSLGKQRANIANELNSHVRTLQAIQVVLAVPEHSKRSDAMVSLSTKLMEWHHVTSDAG
jgi:hypothetical protein